VDFQKIIPFIMLKKILWASLLMLSFAGNAKSEDGYDLWLRYKKCDKPELLSSYRNHISGVLLAGTHASLDAAANEMTRGLSGILDKNIPMLNSTEEGAVVLGTANELKPLLLKLSTTLKLPAVPANKEGFVITRLPFRQKGITIITSGSPVGVLYGSFHFLRLLQSQTPIAKLFANESPALELRMLNHWDNLTRHVERGYAGIALWNWHTLPDYKDPRYTDYARANASLGINAVTVTNVNANALVLTKPYLEKLRALADIFRPYGIRLFLTARFSAPIELDKFKTADPLNDDVRNWWKKKTDEIYQYIPDFGGFLVKANSEGQPGPQNYKRTHADGANMLADAVVNHGGHVVWRAFVYNPESDDRFKQAYEEFKPLDGQFRNNVLVQVKNGPIDFQPREPFSPLFGAMSKTPLMMEFQITQEYLGQATHLVYQAPMFKEILNAQTATGKNPVTVQQVIEKKIRPDAVTGIAGVANIGNDRNWTGHLFGQANWYAFGRLAWNPDLSSEAIAEEWIRQTFNNAPSVIQPVKRIMLGSHEALVNYMTPLGLAHIMGNGHHYGPLPWGNTLGRPDWNPVYYHRADSFGIGFNRTVTGTNALAQYDISIRKQWEDSNSCDEKYLLWFHHVSWQHKMKSGKTLWQELTDHYYRGVNDMRKTKGEWLGLEKIIDAERFNHVSMLLGIQEKEAVWWRNACLLYFQTFSKMPIPAHYEKPDQTLEYYKSLRFPNAPGN
jgi:alpha-glucuronidase